LRCPCRARLIRVGLDRHPAHGRARAQNAAGLPSGDRQTPWIQPVPVGARTPIARIAASPRQIAPEWIGAARVAPKGISGARVASEGIDTVRVGDARVASEGARARVASEGVDARVASEGVGARVASVGIGPSRVAPEGISAPWITLVGIRPTRIAPVPAGLTPRRLRIARRSPLIARRRLARVADGGSGPPGTARKRLRATRQRPGIAAAWPGPWVVVWPAGAGLRRWWVRHVCFGC